MIKIPKRILASTFIIVSICFGFKSDALAIPALQLYVEGAVYDTSTETWINYSSNFVLWVLGDVGAYGNIYDVELAAAFNSNETGTITITPTTATSGQLPSPGDPSAPGAPVFLLSGSDTAPLMNDGKPLPTHGIYGPGVSWNTYGLGNFTLTDSPIGNYSDDVPVSFPHSGQINAYDVQITGYSWTHFDAFDHYLAGNKFKYVKAPFSHDADFAPEPASFTLLGLGMLGLLTRFKLTKRDNNIKF